MSAQMLDLLCAIIRETGCSDSAAASRAGVHPSTVSRWKRDCADGAILLRSAREEFRMAQLSVILAEANAGHARSWRAAAWLLERIFPEDYSPRAKERALFQAQHDALCESEAEGSALAPSTSSGPSALHVEGDTLQNVQNADEPPAPSAAEMSSFPVRVLQNVKNGAPAGGGLGDVEGEASHAGGPLTPTGVSALGADGAAPSRRAARHEGRPLQNVQNSASKAQSGATPTGESYMEWLSDSPPGAAQVGAHVKAGMSDAGRPGASVIECGRAQD
jgi:hypothetical protein